MHAASGDECMSLYLKGWSALCNTAKLTRSIMHQLCATEHKNELRDRIVGDPWRWVNM